MVLMGCGLKASPPVGRKHLFCRVCQFLWCKHLYNWTWSWEEMCTIGSQRQCKLALAYHEVRQGIPRSRRELAKKETVPWCKIYQVLILTGQEGTATNLGQDWYLAVVLVSLQLGIKTAVVVQRHPCWTYSPLTQRFSKCGPKSQHQHHGASCEKCKFLAHPRPMQSETWGGGPSHSWFNSPLHDSDTHPLKWKKHCNKYRPIIHMTKPGQAHVPGSSGKYPQCAKMTRDIWDKRH